MLNLAFGILISFFLEHANKETLHEDNRQEQGTPGVNLTSKTRISLARKNNTMREENTYHQLMLKYIRLIVFHRHQYFICKSDEKIVMINVILLHNHYFARKNTENTSLNLNRKELPLNISLQKC